MITNKAHLHHAEDICSAMDEAAKARGTGIAKRSPDYIRQKIEEGNAVIAFKVEKFAGFCYIESWDNGKYIANSGLIVAEEFRKSGLAKKIKAKIFHLSRKKFPEAKIFGITTSLAVMKINSELGYKPVTFSELTGDKSFWNSCQSCKNFDILIGNDCKMCLCTGMLYDPKAKRSTFDFMKKSKVLKRLKKIEQRLFLQ